MGTWAQRGSQLQTQLYVNRRPDELTAAVLAAFPDLSRTTQTLQWVAPLEEKGFAEPRDRDFLEAIGCGHLAESLAAFWPARGPVWDALAVFDPTGVVLVEAKSHPAEVYGGGTGAGEASRERIAAALRETLDWLGVEGDAERWMDPLRPDKPGHSSVYQSANRLAHLGWLRRSGVDAWLVNLLFADDATHIPTSREEWEQALPAIEEDIGLGGTVTPYAATVILPALDPADA